MIDKELERLVCEKLSVAFEERDITLGHDYVSTTSDYNKRGVLQSSMAARAVTSLHTQELVIRASVALGQIKRVAAALGVTFDPQLGASVKDFLTETIQTQSSKLSAVAMERQPYKSSGPLGTDVLGEFALVLNRTLRDVGAEVDLWVAALDRQGQEQAAGSTQVIVSGDVGIMQTGDYATASQTIILNGEAKEVIAQALEQVAQALEKKPEAQFNINEVKELVRECQDEVGKDQPNQTRLRATLIGVATAIQTSAALGPAYQALKGALGFVGITLP